MPRVWFVKHGESPSFVHVKKVPHFDEYAMISPDHILFYNMNKDKPNPYLQQFGYIMSNIPGDAMIVCETDEGEEDIPLNFESMLPKMLQHDAKQREEFINSFQEKGDNVIFIGK